jgi:hypothetical protein
MGHLGKKLGLCDCSNMDNPFKHSRGHIFDSPVIKLGQNACLGNCSDEFYLSGERSWAIMTILFIFKLRTESIRPWGLKLSNP